MRNYKRMGDEKLQREAAICPEEDRDHVFAILRDRGLPLPVWRTGSNELKRGRLYLPEELAPQACKGIERVCDLPGEATDYLANPKIDGFRLIAVVEDDRVSLMTRGLKWQDGMLPNVEEAISARFPVGTVLDGEICALRQKLDGTIVNDFEHVQAIMNSSPDRAVLLAKTTRPLTYHCFDMLQLADEDLRCIPLVRRLERLNDVVDARSTADDINFTRTPYVECTQEIHDAFVHMGFEGSVLKAKDSTYAHGARGHGWFKIKHVSELDAIIVGYIPGKGKNKGMIGSLVFAQATDDPKLLAASERYVHSLIKAGARDKNLGKTSEPALIQTAMLRANNLAVRGCCRGFSDAEMKHMTMAFNEFIGTVISVKHNGLMAGGLKVRHPQYFRYRPDKQGNEIGWHHR